MYSILHCCFIYTIISLSFFSAHTESSVKTMDLKFPDSFLFGVGTSSYQIEGAHDKDGKGQNIWDSFVETHKNLIIDGSDGKDACKSYEFYEEDVKLLKDLKVQFYRFSISWARICPNGDCVKINEKGIDYYNKLINLLIANGIEPMVTLYHWELPQALQDLGGWTNPIMVQFFGDYARTIFKLFGDRVKWWFTLNEPHLHSVFGYGQSKASPAPTHAPGVKYFGISEYLAGHNMLLAHARAYSIYKKDFYPHQRGKIGIVLDAFNYLPANSSSSEDKKASERARTFEIEWFMHPIFSKEGDYPKLMKEIIKKKSMDEGRIRSRLPEFTIDEINLIRGSSDFVGLNHYTTNMVRNQKFDTFPSYANDASFVIDMDVSPSKTLSPDWIKMEPDGFRDLLKWIKSEYNDIPIFITENGCGDVNELEDIDKTNYHKEYLKVLLHAIHEDHINVIGYSAWSLMDSYEWTSGYTEKFGFYHVDFTDPNRKRTPKHSVSFYRNVIQTRRV